MKKKNETAAVKSDLILYQTDDGQTKIEVRLEDEMVWLTQKLMAELFQKDVRTINEHIANIYEEGELVPEATIRKFRIVQSEGKREVSRGIDHYNLDVIISVGYRVKSHRGTQFRIWATQRLREYIVKGFTLDDDRLKQAGGGFYFDELLARIRDIRSSEKVFWRKVLDIYATSIDYSPDSDMSQQFFAVVQNKIHWAAHGHTAAEIIYDRADAAKPNMGLTTWAGSKPRKTDAEIAKNYLDEKELDVLNRIVTMYLDYAELQALNRKPMHMNDWIVKLDDFLRFTERGILKHSGAVSHEVALKKAHEQFEQYRQEILREPTPVERHFLEALDKMKQLESSKKRGRKHKE
ncbi:MAG: virulence RhuM family protein [Deltaproteobacteria bacterium]|nr:virulence RhuM family protein [Deltaproteobacteria bacterium]